MYAFLHQSPTNTIKFQHLPYNASLQNTLVSEYQITSAKPCTIRKNGEKNEDLKKPQEVSVDERDNSYFTQKSGMKTEFGTQTVKELSKCKELRNYVKITLVTWLGPRISAPTEKLKTTETKYQPGSTIKV